MQNLTLDVLDFLWRPCLKFMDHKCHDRLDATSEGGVKTISPIRPVACLAGQLDVGQSVTRLM